MESLLYNGATENILINRYEMVYSKQKLLHKQVCGDPKFIKFSHKAFIPFKIFHNFVCHHFFCY